MSPLARWDFDDTTEWLRPVDLFLGIELMRATIDGTTAEPSALEFGVWKGAWLIQLVESHPKTFGLGIDPYPGSPTLRQQVLDRAARRGLSERIKLVSTPQEACEQDCQSTEVHRKFSVIHIDGLHDEQHALEDLRYAAEHCSPMGAVIVDDYLHPAYPGVASAMYQFLHERQFAMFLVTRNKAYLCPSQDHAERLDSVVRILDGSGLEWERYSGERTGPRYVQRPDVMGFPVALCLHAANDALVLAGIERPVRVRARDQADRWVPPGLRDLLRPVKRGLQGGLRRG